MPHFDTTNDPFVTIRTTIEAELPAPGVLAISSALPGDGKTGVATGLIRALVASGYATLAIDAGASTPHAISVESASALVAASARPVDAGCHFLAISPDRARTASAGTIAGFFTAVRSRFDYAVVDAATIGEGGLAFARGADGVVLALREGRAAGEADRSVVDAFRRLRVNFIGVVATHGSDDATGPGSALYDRLQPHPRRVEPLEETPAIAVGYGRNTA